MPRNPTPPLASRSHRTAIVTDAQDVDPRWLLRTLAVLIGAAMICAYITLCFLFYQGQWQFVLHPTAQAAVPAPSSAFPYHDIEFDYTETGQPQLHGWWIPATTPKTRYAKVTVLYLHRGDGSLAESQPDLQQLHDFGLNVFCFDYRGFGRSAGPHPTERRMREDTEAAWLYLAQAHKMPATHVILYGEGVGAALAIQLSSEHPRIPAIMFEDPDFEVTNHVLHDPRVKLLPARLLFHERFDLDNSFSTLTVPKLIFLNDPADDVTTAHIAATAAPKFIVHLDGLDDAQATAARKQSLSRFLDEYLPDPALLPK
jgi:pimeloyl-ACP methyl ester carboxylesterase